MEYLITSTFRAIRSLVTPGMLRVFVLSILLTIALLTGFVISSGFFFSWISGFVHDSDWARFLPWFGTLSSAVLAWLLFPGITPIVVVFFGERIAKLIERHDYPAAAPARTPHFWKELFSDIRFSLKAIGLNILVLPLYFFPVLNLIVFYALNGYLLGREYFKMVALRHVPLEDAEALRIANGRTIMTAGIVLTLLATIPIANLFAPFWGVAVMVHLYHKLVPAPQIITM